jgi:toxin ParE1/3/4
MRVRWTKPAADDLTNISDYTEEHFGPDLANQTANSIYDTAQSLAAFPRRGRMGSRPQTRELLIPGLPFVMIYAVHDTCVEILRILHSARNRR